MFDLYILDHVNRSAQVITEFSDDDLSAYEEEPMTQAHVGGLFKNYFQGLWTSFNKAEENKGCKQQTSAAPDGSSRGSWSKRNLFAVFVLIPLIIICLGLMLWSINNGVHISLSPLIAWLRRPFKATVAYLAASSRDTKHNLDVDLLIEKILSHDKFNEIVTSSSDLGSEQVMYFAKTKLEDMENELKAANQALIKDMEAKISNVKSQSSKLQEVDEQNMNELKSEFNKLKAQLLDENNNKEEMVALKNKIDDLLEKHNDLAIKLANCQKDTSQEELILRLKDGLMTKSEFMTRLDESQENLRTGLENQVLEKVRNDPKIRETLRSLRSDNNEVFSIVHEALNVYDADKTGLFDFALESAGGTIASTRCTETYDVTQVKFPLYYIHLDLQISNWQKFVKLKWDVYKLSPFFFASIMIYYKVFVLQGRVSYYGSTHLVGTTKSKNHITAGIQPWAMLGLQGSSRERCDKVEQSCHCKPSYPGTHSQKPESRWKCSLCPSKF